MKNLTLEDLIFRFKLKKKGEIKILVVTFTKTKSSAYTTEVRFNGSRGSIALKQDNDKFIGIPNPAKALWILERSEIYKQLTK